MHVALTDTRCENVSGDIIIPWDYEQICKASLASGQYLMWKAKYYDECDEQEERNRNNNAPINSGMLQEVEQYSDALVQMKVSAQYFDQVCLCVQLQIMEKLWILWTTPKQKVNEPWPEFLAHIKRTVITTKQSNSWRSHRYPDQAAHICGSNQRMQNCSSSRKAW